MRMMTAIALALLVTSGVTSAAPSCHADMCVIDGDTVIIRGERIRIANIDAPELRTGKCDAERRLARVARARLETILGSGDVVIMPGDPASGRRKDRYGRTLATLRVAEADVGDVLVGEGLARPWVGKREPWCISLK